MQPRNPMIGSSLDRASSVNASTKSAYLSANHPRDAPSVSRQVLGSSFVLSILAHRTDLVPVLVQSKWDRRHDRGDDRCYCQRPMRTQAVVHNDRCRGEPARDDIARECHEA